MKISVIITNWNGINLLKKYFETAVKNNPEAQEIIFADDASQDSSVSFIAELQKKYPKIKIIANQKNLGFGKNSNNAVLASKGDLVVLLNSDINCRPNYLTPALKHFKNKNVFGVGFAESERKNWARIFWEDGYLQHEPQESIKTHISAWISGGSSVIRKEYFLKLGGFDEIYSPFYCEDLDLGIRAWKSGFTLLWEPESVVEHRHESTISKFPKDFLNYIKERNRLLTVLRNISDPTLLRENKIAQFFRVLTGPNYIKIIRAAKRQIKNFPPPVVFPKLTDKQILEMFK